MTFAHVWNGEDLWVPRFVADLNWLGLRRMVLKSDQETGDSGSQAGGSRVNAHS